MVNKTDVFMSKKIEMTFLLQVLLATMVLALDGQRTNRQFNNGLIWKLITIL